MRTRQLLKKPSITCGKCTVLVALQVQAYSAMRVTCSHEQTDSFRVGKPCDGEAIRQTGPSRNAPRTGSVTLIVI